MKLSLMTSHMSFMTRMLIINLVIYLKIFIGVKGLKDKMKGL